MGGVGADSSGRELSKGACCRVLEIERVWVHKLVHDLSL